MTAKMFNYWCAFIIAIVLYINGYSQIKSDYIYTKSGDTIYGEVKQSFLFNASKIHITPTGFEKITYDLADVINFTRNNRKYLILKNTRKNSGKVNYFAACLLIDGKVKLTGIACHLNDDIYIIMNRKFYFINVKSINELIWPMLMQCQSFAELHAFIDKKYLRRMITRENWQELALIVSKYNSICP
jgi:hypothetical protein